MRFLQVFREDRDSRLKVRQLLAECVRQTGKTPHAHPHPHREVLTLGETHGDVNFVGMADDHSFVGSDTLTGAVADFGRVARFRPVQLHENGVINVTAESVFHGLEVRSVPVRGQLDPASEPRRQIGDEVACVHRVPRPDQAAGDELRLSTNRGPRPHVADAVFALPLSRDVLFLHPDERPDFVALDTLAGQVPKRHGVDRHAYHSGCRSERITFDRSGDDRGSLGGVELVYTPHYT